MTTSYTILTLWLLAGALSLPKMLKSRPYISPESGKGIWVYATTIAALVLGPIALYRTYVNRYY